ncbi:hypothetical protein QEN19_001112 [Hanseniaspora menglaensis]
MSTEHLLSRLPKSGGKILSPKTFKNDVPERKISHSLSPLVVKEKRIEQLKAQATAESYAAFKEIPSIVMMSYFAGNQVSLMSILQLLGVLRNSITGLINSFKFQKKYEELEMDFWPIYFIYFIGYTGLSGFVYWKGGKMGLWDWENEWIGTQQIPERLFKDFIV